ncbi:5-formyltetrahydrofolate cyclo-ligase [Alloscardovia theropitheci]|uniref:5-formyltetrahydrofolate cyclo-ligase n=1 Tax=Alloscardovia theropitheci TaxID=2496842 RepID=A0A4R0QUF4_9BIFI|nr:5-formyltetrahydrofolate cyclo-ligase [Alloscardovia theropitheci]TCD55035.1 5-formyltetrahydrofolate cyclo-ligase [Alloscardovia theropitheci]
MCAKSLLRRQTLAKMKEQATQRKELADEDLLEQLCQSPSYESAHTIATYMSLPHEVNTRPIIQRMMRDGKRVLIPRTLPGYQLEFVEYDPRNLVRSAFGIMEPSNNCIVAPDNIDLIHVPALVMNNAHYRIGYGAGYYDRYLENFSNHTVSTIYSFQLHDFAEDTYDISIDTMLVSPYEYMLSKDTKLQASQRKLHMQR